MKPNRYLYRIDSRYSAACLIRYLRRCNRFGARLSNSEIRQRAIAQFGW